MEKFLTIAFLFYIGSVCGWILEFIFRNVIIYKCKKWINPGFLAGPYLPIYGVGLCTLYFMCKIDLSFIENIVLQKIILIILISIAMTLIEYIAGIIFIKGMHVKLWDYSDMPGNIQGIICPFYSMMWGILAIIYCFFINPQIVESVNWLFSNLAFSFFVGLFYGILIIDIANSFDLMVKLKRIAKEYNILLLKLEELKNNIKEEAIKRKEKIGYFFTLNTRRALPDIIKEYKEKLIMKEKDDEQQEKAKRDKE